MTLGARATDRDGEDGISRREGGFGKLEPVGKGDVGGDGDDDEHVS